MKKYRQVNNYFVSISGSINIYLRKQISHNLHKNILYLPNAIDYAKFEAVPKDLVGNTVQLINIGRFYHVKNHLYQIEVLKVLIDDYPEFNWQLLMLGEGPMRNTIEEKVNAYQLQENIALPGLVSTVEHLLMQSYIYLHSAFSEPFGLVIVEAMAASLPVVTLDGKGNRDFIRHGVNGYLFSQEILPEEFAKQVYALVTDKKLYHSIALEANKTAKEYDIYPYVTKLMAFYKAKIATANSL
jgi:glycosyltransferase involved in cell wall biosynthesis